MEKGNSKSEMLERFSQMGIPKPMAPIQNPKKAGNPEQASKLDQIRNGSLKGQFSKIIEKTEKTSSMPGAIPVPKVGRNPNEKEATNSPKLEGYAPKSNSEASMIDDIMYGNSNSYSTPQASSEITEDFGPGDVDTKSILRRRLEQKQANVNESIGQVSSIGTNLTEAELNDKIVEVATEVAKEVSKQMIKTVLLEYSKSGKGIIIESKTIKKAEIVGKNKVKIGGKIYKLTLTQ